jgi:hypothetical protein
MSNFTEVWASVTERKQNNDNGNVQSQTIARSGNTWTQSYSYDGVNRLHTAQETGPGTAWLQTFGYDTAGNRWIADNPPGSPSQPYTLSNETPKDQGWYINSSGQTSNQITAMGWNYDNARNIAGLIRHYDLRLEFSRAD